MAPHPTFLHPSTTLIDWVPFPKRPDLVLSLGRCTDRWRRRDRGGTRHGPAVMLRAL